MSPIADDTFIYRHPGEETEGTWNPMGWDNIPVVGTTPLLIMTVEGYV